MSNSKAKKHNVYLTLEQITTMMNSALEAGNIELYAKMKQERRLIINGGKKASYSVKSNTPDILPTSTQYTGNDTKH